MKQELLKNGRDILANSIDNSVNDINENSKNFNEDFSDQLKSHGDYLALYEQDLQKFKELNPILSKKDYHFPDFLNLGKLVNYTFTPSRILNNRSYISSICNLSFKNISIFKLETISNISECVDLILFCSKQSSKNKNF